MVPLFSKVQISCPEQVFLRLLMKTLFDPWHLTGIERSVTGCQVTDWWEDWWSRATLPGTLNYIVSLSNTLTLTSILSTLLASDWHPQIKILTK